MNTIPESAVLVACLCAEWCDTCRAYRPVFEQVKARFPQARFVWVDIEDQSELVDPVEVDTFPTLLIAVGGELRFFGALTPQAETLQRLICDRTADAGVAAITQTDMVELLGRLRANRK